MAAISGSVLALDVGSKRIGIAIASLVSRLPSPLKTLENNEDFLPALQSIITAENIETLVVGLPRGLDGQNTEQTAYIQSFVEDLKQQITLPVHLQDEALTSKKAEVELDARGKSYQRGDIDALAANYILEDFLAEHQELAA